LFKKDSTVIFIEKLAPKNLSDLDFKLVANKRSTDYQTFASSTRDY